MGKMETNVKVREAADTIDALVTPSLLLDRGRLERNIQRLAEHASKLGVVLRPHMKTAKSIDVARHVFPREPGPITVSTIAEAEYFAGHGFRDMTYAVGMSPASAIRAMELCRRTGVDLKLLLDTVEQADALADVREATGVTPSVFIELDCDDHRGGLKPDDPKLLEVADRVVAAGANLVGVLAHAGESYGLSTPDALVKAAENERSATVRAAEILRAHGHACPIVSLGSTPTAHFAAESGRRHRVARRGLHVLRPRPARGRGLCHRRYRGLRAGHRDRRQAGKGMGAGRCGVDGAFARPWNREPAARPGLRCGLRREGAGARRCSRVPGQPGARHPRDPRGSGKSMPELPVGTRIRILPNHACAMAAQHDFYSVVNGESPEIEARWERIRGW